mgnify:CR=1 FL=1
MIADVDKCFADGHAYVAISRAQSLEGLEIRHFKPGTVMTSAFVRLFYHHIDAGTLVDFYRQVDMWWMPVVEHPQRIPPIQGLCTWKDLYERHTTFKGLQERHNQASGRPQGEPLPDMATWEARHGDQQNRRSKDTCFKCGQPGHWANKCTQAGPSRNCKCGQPCAGPFTVRKDGHNRGKRFIKCASSSLPTGCNFFEFLPAAGPSTPSQPPPPSPSQPPPSLPSQPLPPSPSLPQPPSPLQPPFASPAPKRHCPTSAGGAAATAAGEAATGGPLPQVAETSLSIRELKQELARRGIDCDSCVEKQELVQLLHDASVPASKQASPTPSSPALVSPAAAVATAATWAVPLPHDDRQVPVKGGAESVAEVEAARAEAKLAKAEAAGLRRELTQAVSAQEQAALAAAAAAVAAVAAAAVAQEEAVARAVAVARQEAAAAQAAAVAVARQEAAAEAQVAAQHEAAASPQSLCDLLLSKQVADVREGLARLEAQLRSSARLHAALHEAGGLDMLERLQEHPDEQVYLLAYRLLDEHFGDMAAQPTASPARTPARRAPSNPATPRSAGAVRWRGPLAPASGTRTQVAGAVEAVGTAAGTMQASLPSSQSKVRLVPKLADGRVPLELQVGMTLGRQQYGIADPRISRHALELREGATVVALHINPLLVIRPGEEPALFRKGASVQLRAGDELCLVAESHAPALGESAGWAGNPCAFDVHII